MFKQTQIGLDFGTVMIRGIVHHDDQGLRGILGGKLLKEGNKGITVFALNSQMRDLSGSPVASADHMQIIALACEGRGFLLLPPFQRQTCSI
jgi:hypothetical protein